MTDPPDRLEERILAAARAERSPTRRSWLTRAGILLGGAAASMLIVFFAAGGVRLTGRPLALVAATAGGAITFAALATWIAFARGRSVVGRPRALLIAVLIATPVALLAWKVGVSALHSEGLAEWIERPGLRCLRLSLVMAVAPLLALLVARGRTAPVHPALVGAAIGGALGASVWSLVDLWCPVAYPPHLLLGHVLPIVAVQAAGALLGRWLLAIRGGGH